MSLPLEAQGAPVTLADTYSIRLAWYGQAMVAKLKCPSHGGVSWGWGWG